MSQAAKSASASRSLDIRRVAGAIGAEIGGVDLSKELSGDTIARIRQALLDHLVIFFRGQDITPDQHLAFAKRFGELVEYPLVKGLEGHPEIMTVVKLAHEKLNFGGLWHSDMSYVDEPPMGSILLARELPPYGGDTIFANMYLAYETLSQGMKKLLEPLKGVSVSNLPKVVATRQERVNAAAKMEPVAVLTATHPAVRTHPETGRKLLYVNGAHTIRFEGLSDEESAPLLEYLFAHQTLPEFTCRFVWEPGSIAFWDNRCTQHNPVNDYHGHKRVMHRITLAGDRPS